MKSVFEINDYREACKFLQEKYDRLGFERKDYYHLTNEGNLTKTNGVGHGDAGLQYHHICEDVVPSLSNKSVAEANPIEYQKAENMCYCNLLEHAWLHILITENNAAASDEDQESVTGDGGVKWMLLALNSIMHNSSTSWYSAKNEEGRGCNYNVNDIITGSRETYLKILNRYCTSAFIRQRLNKTPEELAAEICILPRKDGSRKGVLSDVIEEASKSYLIGHNVGAFADLENYLRKEKSALVVICTGGGKTTTALEYLRIHGYKALALGPSNTIQTGWKKDSRVTAMNYQTFMNGYKDIDWDKYQVIICDEAHHLQAERWGEGVRWALANKSIKLIGLTATPTADQTSGADDVFEGRVCVGLELDEGIKNKTIYPFGYITSIYEMDDAKEEFERYGTQGRLLWNKLNIDLNKNPVTKILRAQMPKGQRKIIVFCSNIEDIDKAENIMREYDPNLEVKRISSKMKSDECAKIKSWFDNETEKSVCLVTVGMVNEGAHYKGVNTLVMFRKTNSTTLYLQQLGRVVALRCAGPDPRGIVFDFTNNISNLIYNAATYDVRNQAGEIITGKDADSEAIRKIRETIKSLSGNEIIYKDYTEDCVEALMALRDARETRKIDNVIYSAFSAVKESFSEICLFDLDLWKALKDNGPASKKAAEAKIKNDSMMKHATSKKTKDAFDAIGNTGAVKTKRDADDSVKLAKAFGLTLKRGYNFGFIDFPNKENAELRIADSDGFDMICEGLGFKDSTAVRKVIEKLAAERNGYYNLLIATNLD